MALCPQCQRPVALARPQCLYCGAALSAEIVPTVMMPAPTAADLGRDRVEEPPRALVVFDIAAADVETAAQALGLGVFEAAQRLRRGGWQLYRITEPEAAEEEAARLRACGLVVHVVPEFEVRGAREPMQVVGGRFASGVFTLRTAKRERAVKADEVQLVIQGEIHREYAADLQRDSRALRVLHPGFRFHLYAQGMSLPFELDPEGFLFDGPSSLPTSSLLELRRWIDALPAGVPRDEGFRQMPPALAPSEVPAGPAIFEAVAALRAGREGPVVLDNVTQFRFYSGWRAAIERRRTG
jgi:hypothetical protein